MLIAALVILSVTAGFGLWLAGLIMMANKPPEGLGWKQVSHGATGLIGVAVLYLALAAPGRGHGAGKFGWTAFTLLAAALAGGLTILGYHLRKRGAPGSLLALHGSIAVAGYVLLAAYYTSPISYGR